jgi:hypothetical protein
MPDNLPMLSRGAMSGRNALLNTAANSNAMFATTTHASASNTCPGKTQ